MVTDEDRGLVHVDPAALPEGEVPEKPSMTPAKLSSLGLAPLYEGVSTKPLTGEQAAILNTDIPDEELDIEPSGMVYPSHMRVRSVLNKVFGHRGWGMVPMTGPQKESGRILQHWAMIADGIFVTDAWGVMDYQPGDNARMDYGDAIEGARSQAIKRCGKFLGIGAKCWDNRLMDQWMAKYAVEVWCTHQRERKPNGDPVRKRLWRRKEARPFTYPWLEDGADRPGGPKQPSGPQASTAPAASAPAAQSPERPGVGRARLFKWKEEHGTKRERNPDGSEKKDAAGNPIETPWIRYDVSWIDHDGAVFNASTFSKTLGGQAKEAYERRLEVVVSTEKGRLGLVLKELAVPA